MCCSYVSGFRANHMFVVPSLKCSGVFGTQSNHLFLKTLVELLTKTENVSCGLVPCVQCSLSYQVPIIHWGLNNNE